MGKEKTFSQKLFELDWLWGPIGIGVGIIVFTATIFVVYWDVITEPGIAPGADTSSFSHTAQYMVDYFRANHRFPPIDLGWYAGFELQSAPPLISIILGTIYYFTNNVEVATRIFTPLGVGLFFLSMFYVMKKEKYPTINAWMAAMFFAFMPGIFNTYGSYTKLVAVIFLPLCFYFTNKILTSYQNKYIAFLAIIFGLVIYAHPMTGIVFGMALSVYAILYAFLERNIPTRRFFLVFLAIGLGFLLASKFIFAFLFEATNRTTVAIENISPMGMSLFDKIRSLWREVGGLLFFLLPFYVVWREKRPKLTAMLLTSIFISIIFYLYYYGSGSFFPFSLSYAYIWMFIPAFVSAYLLGLLIPMQAVKNILSYFLRIEVAVIILAFFFIAISPTIHYKSLKNYKLKDFPTDLALSEKINSMPNEGRLFPSHYPFGMTNWILGQLSSDKGNVEGHYFGIARIARDIARMADAIHNRYPEYVIHKLEHFNVRYFIANRVLVWLEDTNDIRVGQQMLDNLVENGYEEIFETEDYYDSKRRLDKYTLYYLDEPSNFVMPIDENILIIGKYNSTLAAAISPAGIKTLEGGSIYLDDYDEEFLEHFDTVVLYGFSYHNKEKAETIAKNYTKQGGNLVIELFNMDNGPLAADPDFLGVSGHTKKIKEGFKMEITGSRGIEKLFPKNFELPFETYDPGTGEIRLKQLKEWNSVHYAGLDEILARLPTDEDVFGIIGYKNVEGHKVTFIGMNIFYHLYLTHNETELKLVNYLLTNYHHNPKSIRDFSAQKEAFTPEYLKYKIKDQEKRLVLISLAYAPRWHAYIDGNPVKVNHIDDLMVVQMPSGDHTLELKYESTTVSKAGWLFSIATLLLLLSIITSSNYFYGKIKKHLKDKDESLPNK